MNTSIKEWIKNPKRCYYDGVKLLEAAGGNTNLVRVFNNRSPHFAMDELVHELKKLEPKTDIVANATEKTATTETEISPVAAQAKQMVHDIWVEVSKCHRELYEVGTANGEKEVKARKKIMSKRDPLIERYNSLYEAKELYFNGKLTEEKLKEVVEGKSLESVLNPKESKAQKNISQMSDVELMKKMKAAKAAINRCKNQLLYQQDTAAPIPNPMPDSPKHDVVANRLKEKESELAMLEEEWTKRGL